MRTRLRFLLAALFSTAIGAASASAAPLTCDGFKGSFLKMTSSLNTRFVRPLTVSRKGAARDDIFTLISNASIDAALRCRGGAFRRFEAKIPASADGGLASDFVALERAAMMAAFNWAPAQASAKAKTIDSEAAEYLKASIQRGDVVLSGKTEHHEPGADIGELWTPDQHEFVIVGEND